MLKNSFIIFLITLFTFLIVEIVSRSLNWSLISKNSYNESINYQFSENTLGDIKPNQNKHENSYYGRPFHVKINDQGFRSSKNYCEKCNKIFLLGDSQAFGLYINQDDIISEKLQSKISNYNSDYKIYNAAMTGAEFSSIKDYYNDKLSPNITNSIIIYLFSYSDIQGDSNSFNKRKYVKEFATSPKLLFKIKRFLKKYSGTYNLLSYLKNFNKKNNIYQKYENSKFKNGIVNYNEVSSFIDNINKFDKLIKQDNNRLLVVFHPEVNMHKQDISFEKYLEDILFIDSSEIFQNYDEKNLYFVNINKSEYDNNYKNDSHLTRFSNNLISDLIFETLVNNNYIK